MAFQAPGAPVIVCENLVKIYKIADLEVVALQGLDLNVAQGEMLGIVGASGSGKSSLLNILGGLDRPSAGKVWVEGKDLFKLSETALDSYRRQRVGFVWQQGSRNLIPYLSALENVMLPMRLAGATARSARQRAAELLEGVGLAERQGHLLEQMSGGEQQRVAIAVALVNQPPLLLADEPTGEVDTSTAAQIFGAFRQLSQRYGLTTVIVSHDPGIAHHVDRVVAVRDGKLASETVRRAVENGEHHYQELAVLDGAGRLQIPKEYLARFSIHRRVQLEATEEGILIRPAVQSGEQPAGGAAQEAIDETTLEPDAPSLRRFSAWQERLRRLPWPRRKA